MEEREIYTEEESLIMEVARARKIIRILQVRNSRLAEELQSLNDSYTRLSNMFIVRQARHLFHLCTKIYRFFRKRGK